MCVCVCELKVCRLTEDDTEVYKANSEFTVMVKRLQAISFLQKTDLGENVKCCRQKDPLSVVNGVSICKAQLKQK